MSAFRLNFQVQQPGFGFKDLGFGFRFRFRVLGHVTRTLR